MDQLIDFVTNNPLYAVGVVVLTLLLLVALVKKMVKIPILAVALNAGYVYYLQDTAEKYYASSEGKMERVKDKAGDLIDEAGDLIK